MNNVCVASYHLHVCLIVFLNAVPLNDYQLLNSALIAPMALSSCYVTKWKIHNPTLLLRHTLIFNQPFCFDCDSFGCLTWVLNLMKLTTWMQFQSYLILCPLKLHMFCFSFLHCAVVADWNVQCDRNSLWASIWCRTATYDGYLPAEIMDCWFYYSNYLATGFHLWNIHL